jgi:hypothetical protein
MSYGCFEVTRVHVVATDLMEISVSKNQPEVVRQKIEG